jgi:hypothetical protein
MIATPLVHVNIIPQDELIRSLIFEPTSRGPSTRKLSRSSSFEKAGFRKRSTLKRKQKKAVSFPEAATLETHHRAPREHSDVTAEELWFTPCDFQRFTKTVQQESKTIRLAEEDLLNGVDQSHSIAIRLAESVNKNGHDEKLSMKVFDRLDMRNSGLAEWCREPDVRGLERMASKQLRHAKHFVRKELKKVVLGEDDDADADADAVTFKREKSASSGLSSSLLSRRSSSLSSIGSSSRRRKNAAVKMLANSCEAVTRESRLFARMLGLADELAAKAAYLENN